MNLPNYTKYYVDTVDGNDNNDGNSFDSPWKSITYAINTIGSNNSGIIYLKNDVLMTSRYGLNNVFDIYSISLVGQDIYIIGINLPKIQYSSNNLDYQCLYSNSYGNPPYGTIHFINVFIDFDYPGVSQKKNCFLTQECHSYFHNCIFKNTQGNHPHSTAAITWDQTASRGAHILNCTWIGPFDGKNYANGVNGEIKDTVFTSTITNASISNYPAGFVNNHTNVQIDDKYKVITPGIRAGVHTGEFPLNNYKNFIKYNNNLYVLE